MKQLPIRKINFNDSSDKSHHDRLVQLVDRMLQLTKARHSAASDSEKELYDHQIKATDHEIDTLVYKLYDLTDEEIKIVEGG